MWILVVLKLYRCLLALRERSTTILLTNRCFVLIWKISVALHSICLFFFFSHMIMYTYNQWIIPPKSHKEKNSSYVCLSGQWIIDDRYNGNNYTLLRNSTQSPAQKATFKTSELCSWIQGCECQVRKQPGEFQICVTARKSPLQMSVTCWQIVYTQPTNNEQSK